MTDEVIIRAATWDDGEMLWRWRNAEDVRRASLNSDEIPLESHLDWYRAALADPNREILIAEYRETPIGMVRLDRDGDVAFVNILIDGTRRGAGLGKLVLMEAISKADTNWKCLRALVKSENVASLTLFQSLGFQVVDQGETVVLER